MNLNTTNNDYSTSPDEIDDDSAIMKSYTSFNLFQDEVLKKPDVVNDTEFKSISFSLPTHDSSDGNGKSFVLMDANESLYFSSAEQFCKRLQCSDAAKLKVVSIFGNTGDGKSHTLNHVFFNGNNVFKTSEGQESCTLGVYAALQPEMGVLCLDTEGFLSPSTSNNKRMRMLFKVLAISDVVLYRTRSERLSSDMYSFLGTGSNVLRSHFLNALKAVASNYTAGLGPAVIIFHETQHTKPLGNSMEESAEDKLRQQFTQFDFDIKAFSSLRYVGIQTANNELTNYEQLITTIKLDLENTAVPSPRQPSIIFKAIQALHLKFSGEIVENSVNSFPEECFTCPVRCISCKERCQRSMGHDGEEHMNSTTCKYQDQYKNTINLCKSCHDSGRDVIVNYTESWGYSIITCSQCGEIFRDWKYWSKNNSNEVVRTQTTHVWNDPCIVVGTQSHSGQMVFDRVSYMCETLSNYSAQPAGAIREWCADKVAPKYWRPNHEIIHCFSCKKNFEKDELRKHHCRGCGEGFCAACCQYRMSVPARNWIEPVRVCNECRHQLLRQPNAIPVKKDIESSTEASEAYDINMRKCSETVYNTVTKVAFAALECTKDVIKHSARPSYWVPDNDAVECFICSVPFGVGDELVINKSSEMIPSEGINRRHHCRKCGKAICDNCSKNQIPVPERGWIEPVRVCDVCINGSPSTNVLSSTSSLKLVKSDET